MIKPKQPAYWTEFATYQSFNNEQDLFSAVSAVEQMYDLSDSAKAVLNTLKLHSQHIYGVCWLKVAEIAKKASLSIRQVHRVLKELRDALIITTISKIHTTRGGKAPNVYVINPCGQPVDNSSNEAADTSEVISPVVLDGISYKTPEALPRKAETPVQPTHKNLDTDLDSNSNSNQEKDKRTSLRVPEDFDTQSYEVVLKDIPTEFINIMKPYYGHQPDVIIKRWQTTQKACTYGATSIEYVSWATIKDAWVTTVRAYKLNKVKDSTDHGLGGYYYAVLAEMAGAEYMEYVREYWAQQQERGA